MRRQSERKLHRVDHPIAKLHPELTLAGLIQRRDIMPDVLAYDRAAGEVSDELAIASASVKPSIVWWRVMP